MDPISFTESAIAKLTEIIAEEQNPDTKLRVFVQGGGCSGFQYGFTLDDLQNDDDHVMTRGDVQIVVDAMSMPYLVGASVDFVEDLTGSMFKITNPNAQTTCGCGSSFSPA